MRETRPVVSIATNENGPIGLANGGFACGTFAERAGGTATVRLLSGVRVGVPLDVRRTASGLDVVDGDTTVATVERVAPFVLEPPAVPSWDDALDARRRHPFLGIQHFLSNCVVCGPTRADGLGVTPGPLRRHDDLLAAPFEPPAAFADADGQVRAAAVWGSLDCPSYPAAALASGELCLLGSLTAHRTRPIHVGERLVVVGWTLARGTRSHQTASALVDASGEVVASARATWVALRDQSGAASA